MMGFNPRPSLLTGEHHLIAANALATMFQSTPVTADGRTKARNDPGDIADLFQSTPVTADGRTSIPPHPSGA